MMRSDTKYGIGVLFVIVVIVVLSKFANSSKTKKNSRKNTFTNDKRRRNVGEEDEGLNGSLEKALGGIVQEANKYAFMAEQDQSTLISFFHSVIAMTKLHTVQLYASADEIKNAYDVDAVKLEKRIRKLQESLAKEIRTLCPSLGLPKSLPSGLI